MPVIVWSYKLSTNLSDSIDTTLSKQDITIGDSYLLKQSTYSKANPRSMYPVKGLLFMLFIAGFWKLLWTKVLQICLNSGFKESKF
jgi:hypothetical protein